MNQSTHTLEYYRQKERDVFPNIPGMTELMKVGPDATEDVAARYPDAVFALMTASEILMGDRERNAINQQAYFAILNGENVAEVRHRHGKAMDQYLCQHRWDD